MSDGTNQVSRPDLSFSLTLHFLPHTKQRKHICCYYLMHVLHVWIGKLKIYQAWPGPSEQDPVFPTASPSHQEACTSRLSSCIREQTKEARTTIPQPPERKPQSQKGNQTDHMDHSLVINEAISHATQGHPRRMGYGREFWQNVVHWRRQWQTTSVFLLKNPMNSIKRQKIWHWKISSPGR